MSGQGQLHGGLPDLLVMQPLGRDHELDGLRQVGHVLHGVHRPIGPHAEVGVVGHEPHLPATLAVLELYWGEEKGSRIRELHVEILSRLLPPLMHSPKQISDLLF